MMVTPNSLWSERIEKISIAVTVAYHNILLRFASQNCSEWLVSAHKSINNMFGLIMIGWKISIPFNCFMANEGAKQWSSIDKKINCWLWISYQWLHSFECICSADDIADQCDKLWTRILHAKWQIWRTCNRMGAKSTRWWRNYALQRWKDFDSINCFNWIQVK